METTQRKRKGPIRFEAIVPIAIIVGLVAAYFVLFFDMHLRMGIEYAATSPEAKRLRETNLEAVAGTPAEMASFMKRESERWGNVIRLTGTKGE